MRNTIFSDEYDRRKQFGMGVRHFLSPLRGFEFLYDIHPTAHAVGYYLCPLRGRRNRHFSHHKLNSILDHI